MFMSMLALFGCAQNADAGQTMPVGPENVLSFKSLEGWTEDGQALALGAFQRSCTRILKLNPDASLDVKNSASFYGRAGDWAEACAAAAHVAPGDDAARIYFEAFFAPVRIGNDTSEGLFTGYYEPEMDGALRRGGRYQTPVLRFPPAYAADKAAGRALPTRSEIEDALASGRLDGDVLALVWLADPVDAFFLHVQGSGRVRLEDGQVMRLAFAAKNERTYTSIGKVLIEQGAIPRDEVSMQTIRAYLERHPAAISPLLRQNDSYIFFKGLETHADLGPPGAEGISLTPQRSLAVDRSEHPLGSLYWLDTTAPVPHQAGSAPFRHLMVAQDTGTAIRGAQRGDVFWGPGRDAAEIAGRMKQPGRLIALLPRRLAPR
ncbi:MAG: MltA domain-containing protein [Parvibaculum sp.]|nr:MltA domain-containing protein [Parvibaculum sp.]